MASHKEDGEQLAIFDWARWMINQRPQLKWLMHIPNGGKRNKAEAGRLKAQGVKAGVSDIFLPVPVGKYAGLWLELKAGNNKPTDKQLEFLDDMNAAGYLATWKTGAEASCNTILNYLDGKL